MLGFVPQHNGQWLLDLIIKLPFIVKTIITCTLARLGNLASVSVGIVVH